MNKKSTDLFLKKKTLIAWTKLLLKEGKISLTKCNKMIAKFERLTP